MHFVELDVLSQAAEDKRRWCDADHKLNDCGTTLVEPPFPSAMILGPQWNLAKLFRDPCRNFGSTAKALGLAVAFGLLSAADAHEVIERPAMSAIGPKRTYRVAPHMSAIGGKADMAQMGLGVGSTRLAQVNTRSSTRLVGGSSVQLGAGVRRIE